VRPALRPLPSTQGQLEALLGGFEMSLKAAWWNVTSAFLHFDLRQFFVLVTLETGPTNRFQGPGER